MPASAKIYNSEYTFRNCTNIERVILTKGTGIMQDYGASSSSYATYTCYQYTPWYISRDKLKEIVIEDGVKNIGEYAFYNCSSLTSITIPNSVERIGSYALYKCSGLVLVVIPDGVTSIGDYAFYVCSELTIIVIPDSITSIGDDAFYNCSDLKYAIYSGDEEDWNKITIGTNNSYLTTAEIIFNATKTKTNESGFTYVATDEEVTILSYSGTASNLSIPGEIEGMSVTEIVNKAFKNNTSITNLIIPDSVTSIGDYAFDSCQSLTSVTIGDSVTSIGLGAFFRCTSISEVYYTGDMASWCNISFDSYDANPIYYAKNFYIVGALQTEISIPDTVSGIQNYAFYGFVDLTLVVIPDSVISIGDSAFDGCTNLKTVYFSGTEEQWKSIVVGSGNDALENATIYYNYHSGSDEYSDYSYLLNSDGTIQIFSYSGADTTVTIPAEIDGYKVSGIYPGAFADNTAVTAFTVDSDNEYLSSEKGIIYNKDKTQLIAYPAGKTDANLTVSINVTGFAEDAFLNNTKLKNVYYEGTVADWCAIEFADENANPLFAANNLFIGGYAVIFLSIPDGVEKVNDYVFYGCESIANITLADSVKVIGEKTFAESYATAVTFGAGITEIGNSAFAGCTDVADVYYPGTAAQFADVKIADGNEVLIEANIHLEYKSEIKPVESGKCGDSLYWSYYDDGRLVISGKGDMTSASWSSYSSSIKSVTITEGVTGICSKAFYDYSKLTSITIPDSVERIGSYAFYRCSGLESITIPDSVTSIGQSAFYYCTGLKIVIYSGKEEDWEKISIGSSNGNFEGATRFYGDFIPESKTEGDFGYIIVGEEAVVVSYSGSASSVLIPSEIGDKKITALGSRLFYNSTTINSVTIPDGVKSIGYCAFFGCKNLTSVIIPDSVTSISDAAFLECSNLASITIPDGVKIIGDSTFYNCTKLTSITIPDSVTSIDIYAFYGCTGLKELTMPVSAEIYNSQRTFYNCKNIEKITFTKGTGVMPDYSTSEDSDDTYYKYTPWYISNSKIKEIVIEEGVGKIGCAAFQDCTSLTNVYYTGDIASWCNISFGSYSANPIYYTTYFYIDGVLQTDIVIPDTVTTIKDYTFSGYERLASVTIPDSVTSIGYSAFRDCTGLNDVYYTGDIESWCGIEFYSSEANPLYYAKNFYVDNTLVKALVIPDTVTEIKDYVFSGFGGVTTVIISDSVTSIGDYAFYGCSKLSKVFYYGSQEEWNSISIGKENAPLKNATKYYNHVHNYNNEVVDIPSTCQIQGRNALMCECGQISGYVTAPLADHNPGEWETVLSSGCETEGKKIKKCTVCSSELISEAIPSLGGHIAGKWETEISAGCVTEGKMVQRCTVCSEELLSTPTPSLGGHISGDWVITTYPTTSSKGEKTHYCSRCSEGYETETLSELDAIFDYLEWIVNDDNTVNITKCDTDYAGEISIPTNVYGYPVTGVTASAFDYCDKITKIIIPASVDIIGEDFARYCGNLESIVVDSANEKLSSENGVLYNKDKTRIIVVPAKAIDGEFVMPSTVVSFAEYAFDAHEGIRLTISDNLSIDNFYKISASEFVASDSCVNFTVENGVLFSKDKTILARFPIASDISEYVVPDSVTTIGDYAFYESSLKRLTLPGTIVECGSFAFDYCGQLERIDFPCLDCWCKIDFSDYSGVEWWKNGTALYIDDVLVDGLDVGVKHPENFAVINDNAFTGYKYFREVIVPSRVTKIGDNAFASCENLELLYIYGDITEWGDGAFRSCNKIHTIYLGEGITEITGDFTLSVGGYNSKHLYIPKSLTYIGNSVFWGNKEQHFETICYAGTASQWENVTVSYNNYMLTNANLLYHEHGSYHYTTEGAKDPTCTEDGYTGNLVHAYCGFCIELGEVIPATGHDYEMVSSSDATCTEDGGTTYKCLTCGDVYTDVEQKTGHTMGENEIIKEPTCSEPGEKRCVCTVCGETYIEEISTISHTESVAVKENFVDSTCIEKGHYDSVVYCSVCGEELSTEVVEVDFVGHTEGKAVEENIIDSTCTEKGSYESVIYCTVCGKEISRETKSIPAKGHSWSEWETTISPTTTTDGVKVRECLVCGEGENGIVPKTGITVILTDSNGNVVSEQVIEGDLSEVTFDGIEDGEYTVTVSRETYVSRGYTVTATDGETAVEFKLNHIGDINGDGKVNTVDVARANASAKGVSALTGYDFACADVNGDGRVNTVDVARMNAHAKGVTTLW